MIIYRLQVFIIVRYLYKISILVVIVPDHCHAVARGRCPAYFAFVIIPGFGGQEAVFIGIFIFGHAVSVCRYLFVQANVFISNIVIVLVISIPILESAITVSKRLVVDTEISYGYIVSPFIALVNQLMRVIASGHYRTAVGPIERLFHDQRKPVFIRVAFVLHYSETVGIIA